MSKFAACRTFQEDNRIVSRFVDMSMGNLGPGSAVIVRVA